LADNRLTLFDRGGNESLIFAAGAGETGAESSHPGAHGAPILCAIQRRTTVTLLWFVVWLIFNLIGDKEPLVFAPVNWWAGLLLLAVAVDLASHHGPSKKWK
jgi:hypothetical protein